MAWLLFIDESGQDRRASPYEVLAGVAVQDRVLWRMISEIHDVELRHFGRRYSLGRDELKGTKILKRKVFSHASLNTWVAPEEVTQLAKAALDDGARAGVRELKALALAKMAYVEEVFNLCTKYDCRAFASIVETDAPQTALDGLRKDYAFLFERFFYFLEDQPFNEYGIVIFDELEKSRSHILIDQTHKYFKETAIGKMRASRIIPEPLFVHSDLTTGIQLADLLAYVVSWGFRTPQMKKPARPELSEFAAQVARLRYRTTRQRRGNPQFVIWSFSHISDMRTRLERDGILEEDDLSSEE